MKNEKWPLVVQLKVNGKEVGSMTFASNHPSKVVEFANMISILPNFEDEPNVPWSAVSLPFMQSRSCDLSSLAVNQHDSVPKI